MVDGVIVSERRWNWVFVFAVLSFFAWRKPEILPEKIDRNNPGGLLKGFLTLRLSVRLMLAVMITIVVRMGRLLGVPRRSRGG